jgi:hypothetical protein
MNNYAPVLISVLDRDVHFKNCVESLAKCTYSEKTHLFIALDAPFAEKHFIGYQKVISYINKIKGFKQVTLFKRKQNMGSSPNQFLAMEDIFKQYDRLIFTEDDNIFSPNFLDFVNQGLELFKDRKDIFSISGHNYLIDIPNSFNSNYYAWPGFDAWGVGIWKEKWGMVDFTKGDTRKKGFTLRKVYKLYKLSDNYFFAYYRLIKKGVLSDDFALSLHIIENNMTAIFPIISKVRNVGHDGSGENCKLREDYSKQYIDIQNEININANDFKFKDHCIYRILKLHFQKGLIQKIKLWMKYLSIIAKNH